MAMQCDTRPRAARNLVLSLVGLVATTTTAFAICSPTDQNRPVCPRHAPPEEASFLDPTAVVRVPGHVKIGKHVYVGPFAGVHASPHHGIEIGESTNLQDQVILEARDRGEIKIGDEFILAHGARVNGPARLGRKAVHGQNNAGFVGFNSLVDGGSVEHDAMVLHLARVAPGITIKTGRVVLSGKNVTTQAQADDPMLGKVIPITDGLRAFMEGVLHVNTAFAREYTRLYHDDPRNVSGINYDPGNSDFNPHRDLPTLAGVATQDPRHRNRIIGAVALADSSRRLADDDIGDRIALRADEGSPFGLGPIARMDDRTTFHALEHTGIDAHDHIHFGYRAIVHGGSSAATQSNHESATVLGSEVQIGSFAVVFRSVIGDGAKIGCASLVDGSTLPRYTNVPARTVVLSRGHAGAASYPVEWDPGCARARGRHGQ